MIIGSSTFSNADIVAMRLNVWKTKPVRATVSKARTARGKASEPQRTDASKAQIR
jgi:hypothetical protein